MNKQRWLDAAEVFDSWRVIPRVMLFLYAFYVSKVTLTVIMRYFEADATSQQSAAMAALVGVIFTAITGFSPWIFKIYSDNGRDWDQRQQTTTTIQSTTTSPATPPP